MKYLFILFLTTLGLTSSDAQSIMRNFSLELEGSCPTPVFPNTVISSWTQNFGTADYYNAACGNPGGPTTTNNSQPFDGSGFAGIFVYGDTGTAFIREYIHGVLDEPLEKDKFYRCTFYVKPVNNDAAGVSYGITNMGMFIADSINDSIPDNRVYSYLQPQIVSNSPIVALNNWTAVCGVYKARGGERYITIGNFNEDGDTEILPLDGAAGPQTSYYLVDYVQIVENDLPELPKDTLICEEGRIDLDLSGPDINVVWNDGSVSSNYMITESGTYWARITSPGCSYVDTIVVDDANCFECKVYTPTAFSPNGDNVNDILELSSNCDLAEFRFQVFDRWGQKVFESTDINVSWDGGSTDKQGVYTYTLEYKFDFFRRTQTNVRRGVFSLLK